MNKIKYLETLRIGPFTVKINTISAALGDAKGVFGTYSGNRNIITMQDEIDDPIRAVEVFIHEIVHAIWYIYGTEERDCEERMVSVMGVAWAQIYRDNPELLKWIAKYSKG